MNHTTVTQLVHDLSAGRIKRDPNARLRVPGIGMRQLAKIERQKRVNLQMEMARQRQKERAAMFSNIWAGKV